MEGETARKIAAEIVEDYAKGRAIDQLTLRNRPEKETIIEVLDQLFAIIYGGYFRNRHIKLYDARTGIAVVIEDTMYRMQKQIAAVLPYSDDYAQLNEQELNDKAQEIVFSFFKRIPAVRAVLDTDLEAILEGDPAATNKDLIIFSYPGFYAITVYRLAHELSLLSVPMIPRMMTEHAHSLTGIDLHPGATIGRYFFIDHGTGIVIGETTRIAEHVKLYQGVTLGALSTRGGQSLKGVRRHPTIEENVTIYAGASVLGNTVVGHDSIIGGNVFITSDVPAGTRVSLLRQDLSFRQRGAFAAG